MDPAEHGRIHSLLLGPCTGLSIAPTRPRRRASERVRRSGSEEGEHGEDTAVGVRVFVEVQLEEDLGDVGLDGPLRDVEPGGDGLVGETFGDEAEDLSLTLAEHRQGVVATLPGEQAGHDGRIDDRFAFVDLAYRLDECRR